MKNTLHIYTRVSTTSQEEEGTSLETQLELGIERAKKLGMKHKVWDEGGQSSSKDDLSNRPVLVDLLKGVEDGDVHHLYVWNTDRLSRNLQTWGMIRFRLIKNEVTLHTPTGKQILSDPQTNLMLGIMSEFSQYENQLRAERFRLGKIHKIKKGFWKGGPPPFGYNLSDGLLRINKKESIWVAQMFQWYLDGDSIPVIKDKLLKNGVMTRRKNPVWSERSIWCVLIQNTHYQGYWNYLDKKSGQSFRVDCPTMVSQTLILNVRQLHESRKKTSSSRNIRPARKHDFLLKELLECASCGGSFGGWKSSAKQQPYYYCVTAMNNSRKKIEDRIECNSQRNLNLNNSDELVWETVRKIITESNIFKESIKAEMLDGSSIISTTTDAKKIEKKLKTNDNLIKKISESIVNQETDKLIGIRSPEEIEDVLGRLDQELLKLKSKKEKMLSELSQRHQNAQWVDWVKEWGSRLEEMKNSEFKFQDKKEFLNTVVDKIIVSSEDRTEHELTIKFKLPYVNDELVWSDNKDKSKGYILKDGSYSKTLRMSLLKKN